MRHRRVLPDHVITNVTLRNIKIKFPGGGNKFYAYRGVTPAELDSIPEMPKSYPEFSQFRELPAWGFYIRHAKGVTLENVELIAQKPDYRPAVVLMMFMTLPSTTSPTTNRMPHRNNSFILTNRLRLKLLSKGTTNKAIN